jgi:hypothetical protein
MILPARFYSFLLLFSCILISCSSPPDESYIQESQGIETYHLGKIDSAVIYCWCFENGESRCFTFAAIKPKDLCDSSNRLLSITGSGHISNLQTFFNSAKTQKNKFGMRDARFVIKCYEPDSCWYLTYADYNDSTLVIDEDRELKFNQPVLEWIMNEMKLSEIDCPE